MRSLGKNKSNPITSKRISASVQYPNGGILLPEHDMFRALFARTNGFGLTDRAGSNMLRTALSVAASSLIEVSSTD
jgi:hypothetical protein